jgi:hypothetical protein
MELATRCESVTEPQILADGNILSFVGRQQREHGLMLQEGEMDKHGGEINQNQPRPHRRYLLPTGRFTLGRFTLRFMRGGSRLCRCHARCASPTDRRGSGEMRRGHGDRKIPDRKELTIPHAHQSQCVRDVEPRYRARSRRLHRSDTRRRQC